MRRVVRALLFAALYIIFLVIIPNLGLQYVSRLVPEGFLSFIDEPMNRLRGIVTLMAAVGVILAALAFSSNMLEDWSPMKLISSIASSFIWFFLYLLLLGFGDLSHMGLTQISIHILSMTLDFRFFVALELLLLVISIANKTTKFYFARKEHLAHVPTGLVELDDMLCGGIPVGYSMLLISPPLDERDLLMEHFIKTGIGRRDAFLYVSATWRSSVMELAKKKQNLYLMFCREQADLRTTESQNIFAVKSLDDLTGINITLDTIFSEVDEKGLEIKSGLLDVLSDIILIHDIKIVRKWLGDVLTKFKSKNITTLWTLDPGMHPEEAESTAISLFDGHLTLEEKMIDGQRKKVLRIRRLYGMKYLEKELILTKEKLT